VSSFCKATHLLSDFEIIFHRFCNHAYSLSWLPQPNGWRCNQIDLEPFSAPDHGRFATFLAFLREELKPRPGRLEVALRINASAVLALWV